MKYRIVEVGGGWVAEKKGWFLWSEVCYRGLRTTYSSALQDIKLDKQFDNPIVVYKEG